MYTNKDLEQAVKQGIFSAESVENFKRTINPSSDAISEHANEEPLKLISSFNDIFVVIANLMLLFSVKWFLSSFHEVFAYLGFIVLTWVLAEIFIKRRKMAFPAIVLLLCFVWGSFQLVTELLNSSSQEALFFSGLVAAMAAYLHWLRFKVPITVAAGGATLTVCFAAILMMLFEHNTMVLMWGLCLAGIGLFVWAMFWDSKDLARQSYRSDVAFWLHLLAAPLIIHPIFTQLGIFLGEDAVWVMLVVLLLYAVITFLSIAIDRRAFMVSALAYVIYSVSEVFDSFELNNSSLASTSLVLGLTLIVVSVYWQKIRQKVLALLPDEVKRYLP